MFYINLAKHVPYKVKEWTTYIGKLKSDGGSLLKVGLWYMNMCECMYVCKKGTYWGSITMSFKELMKINGLAR